MMHKPKKKKIDPYDWVCAPGSLTIKYDKNEVTFDTRIRLNKVNPPQHRAVISVQAEPTDRWFVPRRRAPERPAGPRRRAGR